MGVYVYIYIYIYICMYVCMYVCVCVPMSISFKQKLLRNHFTLKIFSTVSFHYRLILKFYQRKNNK